MRVNVDAGVTVDGPAVELMIESTYVCMYKMTDLEQGELPPPTRFQLFDSGSSQATWVIADLLPPSYISLRAWRVNAFPDRPGQIDST